MINAFDLGTMRMIIVPLGFTILENGEEKGQVIFSPESLTVINAKIAAKEYTESEVQEDDNGSSIQPDELN